VGATAQPALETPRKIFPNPGNKTLGSELHGGYTPGFVPTGSVYPLEVVIGIMVLTQILQPKCVRVPLRGRDKDAVIAELVELLDENGLLQNKEPALDAVMTRERTRSTGIGSGIAIPHGKCSGVQELVMALGIAAEPIEFDSVDGKPVSIVILLVSPVDQTGPHIQALARISRLMLDEGFRSALTSAPSATAAYELLSSHENQ
jgi:fructose-specific phosphotransferase system IIA component